MKKIVGIIMVVCGYPFFLLGDSAIKISIWIVDALNEGMDYFRENRPR